MSNIYEGRDLLRTQDIYGTQSMTNLKNRNVPQEQFVPEVLRHVPDQYQRQADMQKHIRNPHYNDFRYDLMQMHPHFKASSIKTDYRDSLESFATSQMKQKVDLTMLNSHINYDFIRCQKNKNTFDSLNPPFANLQDNLHDHRKDNLKATRSFAYSPDKQNLSPVHYAAGKPHFDIASPSSSPNARNLPLMQQSLYMKSPSPMAKIPEHSLTQSRGFLPTDREGYTKQPHSPIAYQHPQQQPIALSQSQPNTSRNRSMQPSPSSPALFKRAAANEMQQQQAVYKQDQTQMYNKTVSDSPKMDTATSTMNSYRKTYKPYNIISHNRYIPYTPRFDMPGVTWDKYGRQQFNDFDKKGRSPVEIIKGKNDQLNVFSDYTTWNQKYGQQRV